MVPKVIHHIVGSNQSDLVKRCLHSWEALTQYGFKIIIWTDATIEIFLEKEFPFALAAFKNARNHGEAADIARYLIIYALGGYYVDWDIELLKPHLFINLHETHRHGYLLIDPVNGSIASEHFSAIEKESYLLFLSKKIVDTFDSGERELMTTPSYSGPYRMKVSLKQHGGSNQRIVAIKEVFEFDYWEIRANKKTIPTKAMVHYWVHSWVG